MTLKNFFTITELKDGLTNPARINELITIMQNEKDNNITQNINETTEQWSAVATTIANTENKECLELFIKLDGLIFINKWINDAQKFVNSDGENELLEELMILLLRAVERLEIDNRVSGIGKTVQGLFGHFSLLVREKAKSLSDKWAPVEEVVTVQTDVNSIENDKQEIDEKEIPKDEIVTESETEIIKVENEDFKSEILVLEDVNEKQEIEGAEELTTLASSTDVDHVLESVKKTEITENTTDKDEEMIDGEGSPHDHNTTTMEFNTTCGIGDSTSGGFQETENPKTTSNSENDSDIDEDEKKDDVIQSDDDSGNSRLRFSKKSTKSQDDLINNRPSDMDLDYGMVDPLELARQVAIEVEREIDSREQSCSSTSTNENGPQSNFGPVPEPGPEPEPEPTQVSDKVQESAPEKGFSGFDLNQEFSSEEAEIDGTVDPILTPGLTRISVVSASRAAAAANGLLPGAPLQFEGALGWKGSAATSAFRRIPEGEKTFSPSSSQNNSNQWLDRLDFDLNVTENSDDKVEKVQLDLNSLGEKENDVGIISLDWKRETRVGSLRQNGPRSPSVSSSSSPMQPSFKNIDLNLNNNNDNNNFLGKLLTNKRERDESVISIFGTQVEVKRTNEYTPPPHQQHNQPNGRLLEPSVDFSLGRPGSGSGSCIPYANLPGYNYGHNGYTMGAIYGPPGAPIPSFSQPSHFNMAATGGSNGAGPSRNSLDLNSGFVTEMGNRENNGGLRQFLKYNYNPNQNHNYNHNQASSSSVVGGKREEPDGGWELFPMNYKHQQPPWQ